ncbi:aminotransferase class-III [Histoplasma capsulatum G186AR]|uniref:Aminotransferase class-III n=1 Tax=Ajellomyces capsulatus (strain G186AR / H82 / ATCC MYA-2454 / RMSCC 2432) TaxID=447093 RepID=C0NUH8_AJECG|nr:aminotransferase class-III [Histoplasma capsulatum G186AR]EEH05058.1 aminotransferase class-III [Histoplasma capsulatum G186AR]
MSRAMLPASYTRYKIRNPKSYAAHQEAIKHLPGGNTRSSIFSTPFPLTFTSGHKATLTSLDGDTYTDFLGEYSAGLFGHSNERISNAVSAAMAGGWNFGGISVHESAFAERVCDRFKEAGMEMDGNDETRKTITKSKILVFSNAYHGATLTFPITLVADADGGDDDGGGSKVVSGGTASAAATNLPHDFVIAPSLAAILFEPMQGAGGCRTATKEFARFLRQVADEHSALLIADEVMTSRLAPAGLCVGLFGITPDIMTLGKWVGGGMSFGAFGGRREIMELYLPADPGERKGKGRLSHAGTFNNNILTMVAGFEALGIYTKERVGVLNRLGDRLRKGIWTLLADRRIISKHLSQGGEAGEAYGIVEVDTFDRERQGKEAKALPRMFVSGHGSLINVRFTGFEAKVWQALFYHHMLDEHIYLAMRGYMALTIETTEDDVDRLIRCVEGFLDRTTQDCETEI